MGNSHKNLLLRNHWANCNQTFVEWSLDGPLPKLCPVIPTSNQDGHQAKNRKKGGWNYSSWNTFLAHLTQRVRWAIVTTECPSSVVRPSNFHILINSSEITGPIWTKLWWNGPWMGPFQNCFRWSRLPTKMAAKLKIEKRGDVHCCVSNELKF
jgi:hypothetical protein